MTDSVLVVAAHPDDEVLGCGGTLARLVEQGSRVCVMFMTDGVGARAAEGDAASARLRAASQALSVLGVELLQAHDFADNRMDQVALLEVVKVVEAALARVTPAVVYTHHAGDINIDHAVVHRAVMTACRPLPGRSVREIYSFEVPSSSEWAPSGQPSFRPNCAVDISKQLSRKLQALACYDAEMRAFPHPRSVQAIEAQARWRGSQFGLLAAEAFQLERQIRP